MAERSSVASRPDLGVGLLHAHFERHAHDFHAIGVFVAGAVAFRHRTAAHVAPRGAVPVLDPGEAHDGRPSPGRSSTTRVSPGAGVPQRYTEPMADGNYPDIYPDDPRGCAGCGRLPEQVEAVAGPAAGPRLCRDCVDRGRSALTAEAGTCALCERRTGPSRRVARLGEAEIVVCAACLDGLAAVMAEPD